MLSDALFQTAGWSAFLDLYL